MGETRGKEEGEVESYWRRGEEDAGMWTPTDDWLQITPGIRGAHTAAALSGDFPPPPPPITPPSQSSSHVSRSLRRDTAAIIIIVWGSV